jgi:hypothetical protein
MAKPTKHASLICATCSILALLGILIGIAQSSSLIAIIFLLPAVVYEVYRTEGKSTKWASWGLLVVFALELVLIIGNVSYDLAEFFGTTSKYVGGYRVPLGDIKIVAPAMMAVLSVILFVRTRGRYTKWLAVIICITSFAIVYILEPTIFKELLRFGIDAGLDQLRF